MLEVALGILLAVAIIVSLPLILTLVLILGPIVCVAVGVFWLYLGVVPIGVVLCGIGLVWGAVLVSRA